MLRFKKATAKNYLSIGEVEINLDNQGLVLIEGINDANETFQSNGSGKSTLLSIVTYALFNKTPNGLTADAVINRKEKKNMVVTLDFEKDGVPYRIERYRKHKTHKNTTKFYQGENDLTTDKVADTDKKIQSVFGIDYLTYMNSIMYGQGDVEIFAKTTDKGKKQILENLADIGVYRFAQDVAKEKAKQAQALVEDYEAQIAAKQREIEFVDISYQNELAGYQNTASAITSLKSVIADLKEEILQEKHKVAGARILLETELAEVNSKLAQSDKGYQVDEIITTKLDEAKTNVSKLATAKLSVQQRLVSNKTALQKVTTETNCYVCGAPLNTEHREKEMSRLNEEIKNDTDYLAQLDQAITQYTTVQNEVQAQYDIAWKEVQELNSGYQQLVQQQYAVQTKINEAGTNLADLENTLAKEEAKLEAYQEVTVPTLDEVTKTKLTEEIKEIQTKLTNKRNDAEQYKVLAEEVFSNKGIRSDVLDLVTPFLNERANKYLAILSGSDIEIKFSTQTETAKGELKDKFDLEVVNGSGGETYQANSAGEKKRIDLAISFAIQDLVQSKANIAVNLGLYDECFDGLDSIGCENVIKILKERQKDVSSIFVITHSENLKALFENVITMKKENGSSFLVN